jgi:hypothetical protein
MQRRFGPQDLHQPQGVGVGNRAWIEVAFTTRDGQQQGDRQAVSGRRAAETVLVRKLETGLAGGILIKVLAPGIVESGHRH